MQGLSSFIDQRPVEGIESKADVSAVSSGLVGFIDQRPVEGIERAPLTLLVEALSVSLISDP